MKKKGSFFKFLLKFVVLFFLVILIAVGALYLYFRITKIDEKKYIPSDFMGYIKIDSMEKVYSNLIDLRALDVILTNKEYYSVYKAILDFRSSNLSKNFLLKSLINMKANVIVDKETSFSILVDLGFKSVLLKILPLAQSIIGKTDKYSLESVKKNDYTIYRLELYASKQVYYFSIKNNLLLFSFFEKNIDKIYESAANNSVIYNNGNYYYASNQIRKDGIAELYIDTDALFDAYKSGSKELRSIFDKFKLVDISAASLKISNEELFLQTFTQSSTEVELIKKFLDYSPGPASVAKYLPEDTNVYASINFKSFEEFYKVFLTLQEGKYDETVEKINLMSKALLQMDINEILFSWIGSEVGLFTSSVSNLPSIFLKIKDKDGLFNVLKKLADTIFFNESSQIEFEGVTLNKIGIPDFIQAVLSLFVKGFDAPYYLIKDDFIFFSMDMASLSNLENRFKNDKTLIFEKVYKNVSSRIEKNGNAFVYFNLGISIPKILQSDDMISKLIRLYEKGALSLNINGDRIKIDFAARGINEIKTRAFPGFPKYVKEGIATDIICMDITGSKLPELIYINKENKIVVADLNNQPIFDSPQKINEEINANPAIFDFNKDGKYEFAYFSTKGKLYYYNSVLELEDNYPLDLTVDNSFPPVLYGNKFLGFDKNEKKLYLAGIDGIKNYIDFEFKSPLLSAPTIFKKFLSIYPKSFSGTVYLTDADFNILKGWPCEGGGIGFGSPQISDVDRDGNIEVVYLSQSGILNVWNKEGERCGGSPFKLDGVYYTQPVIGDVTGDKKPDICALSKDGVLTILSHNGDVLLSKKIKEADGKERKLLLFDANSDGKSEIYIYGDKNTVIALNGAGELLPGFPVAGSGKPCFTDFNFDGIYEMAVGSYDNNIYVYSVVVGN
ncbi:MAG TPA: hypothetical protein PLI57_04230 [Spirochaetota bacterium]|nr:hypothetical protein [Spirochaetota bacterium]